MYCEMSKIALLNAIKTGNVVIKALKNASNSSKLLKANDFLADKVSKWLKGGSMVYIVDTTKYGVNTGKVLEIVYNAYKGNDTNSIATKGMKDLKSNRVYTEIKTLINPSNPCKITPFEITNNKGIVFITLKGNYKMTIDQFNAHKNELRKDKEKFIFTSRFIEQYGKRIDLDF